MREGGPETSGGGVRIIIWTEPYNVTLYLKIYSIHLKQIITVSLKKKNSTPVFFIQTPAFHNKLLINTVMCIWNFFHLRAAVERGGRLDEVHGGAYLKS